MSIPKFSLPHGASGIELGNFVISFGSDKIVALAKHSDSHYTLHAGYASGVLDFHRTWRDREGAEHHQTVFAMLRSDLSRLLADLSLMTSGVLRLVRRLRLGWLYRNNIGVVWGLDPITDQEIAAVTRRRKKKLIVDESKLHDQVKVPEFLEDIWTFPDGAFSLMHRRRKIGIGIKITDPSGCPRLYWLKFRDMSKFLDASEGFVRAAVLKYAIPKEKYKNHGVLEPQKSGQDWIGCSCSNPQVSAR